ncbi:HAUS augmin-like complex subunit 1 [Tubulanus polymorphus]|uniref:HAUS augmin-like complex subunit 1 n=1 Tax=Tubulanus polymorphus TaxID=672921 RepID=UPI003DA36F0F
MEFEEKLKLIQPWLCTMFGDGNVPQFEICERTVNYMYELMSRCQTKENHTALEIKDLNRKKIEYEAEAKRLHKIISTMDLSYLSDVDEHLKVLTDVAESLKLSDVSETHFMLGLETLKMELFSKTRLFRQQQKLSRKIQTEIETMQSKCTALEKTLLDLEQQARRVGPKLKKRTKETRTISSKSEDYRIAIQNFKEEMNAPYTDHGTLVEKSKMLSSLEEKLAPLNKQLDSYCSLPPDMSSAKVKIEELKRDIESVESALSDAIDQMHIGSQ